MQDKSVLVIRANPGLGDQICASVALRAAQEKYGSEFKVCAAVGLDKWRVLFADQDYCSGGYLPSSMCRVNRDELEKQFAYVFSLDGVDERHLNLSGWDPNINKTEVFCKAVDHLPQNMCPHWNPTSAELVWAEGYLGRHGLKHKKFIVYQWAPDPGLWWKTAAHRTQTIDLLLSHEYAVLILHSWKPGAAKDPEWQALVRRTEFGKLVVEDNIQLRQLGALLSIAQLVISPDSALLHFAAAVDVPCLGLFGGTMGAAVCRHYPNAQFIQGHGDVWLGRHQSPHDLARRMESITAMTVAEKAEKIIGGIEGKVALTPLEK